jgi:hypothetical protein
MGWVNVQSAIHTRVHPTLGDPPTWEDQRVNFVAIDHGEI